MGFIHPNVLKILEIYGLFFRMHLGYPHFLKPPAEFGIRSYDFWIPDHRIENSTAGLGNLEMGFA